MIIKANIYSEIEVNTLKDLHKLKPDHFENLVTEDKTGFNSFYSAEHYDNNR